MEKTYYIYLDAECKEMRAAAYIGGQWRYEQANGEWFPVPSGKMILRDDIPHRYFLDEDEVNQAVFTEAEGTISLERHTVFANGVDQICYTKT